MKQLLILLLIVFIFSRCHRNETTSNRLNYELSQNPLWATEPFKNDYTIQFPAVYKGGMIGFEGNTFQKQDTLDFDRFWYAYVSPLFAFDFGDTLQNIQQPSIQFTYANGTVAALLDQRIDFTLNNELVGIFYHNNTITSLGRLFWKDDGVFKEALNVEFKIQNLPLIKQIIRTIKQS